MSNELATRETSMQRMDKAELLNVLCSSLYPGASMESVGMVLSYCEAAGLDPMQKPVHIVPIWDKSTQTMRDVIMPGIGLYRIQASRSGQWAGVSEPEFGPIVTETLDGLAVRYPEWCRVTTRRILANGQIGEFTAIEYWLENYATAKRDTTRPNAMWAKRPRGQLAKCSQAQALRLAFPEIGAAPTADEMAGKSLNDEGPDVIVNVHHDPAPHELPPYPADQFAENVPKWLAVIESGRRTADDIIAMVETRGVLTDRQKKLIRQDPADGEVVDAESTESQKEVA